jgi:hypothetical protein
LAAPVKAGLLVVTGVTVPTAAGAVLEATTVVLTKAGVETGLVNVISRNSQKLSLEQYGVPGAAVHYGGDSWLVANGAGAVGDGKSLGL